MYWILVIPITWFQYPLWALIFEDHALILTIHEFPLFFLVFSCFYVFSCIFSAFTFFLVFRKYQQRKVKTTKVSYKKLIISAILRSILLNKFGKKYFQVPKISFLFWNNNIIGTKISFGLVALQVRLV